MVNSADIIVGQHISLPVLFHCYEHLHFIIYLCLHADRICLRQVYAFKCRISFSQPQILNQRYENLSFLHMAANDGLHQSEGLVENGEDDKHMLQDGKIVQSGSFAFWLETEDLDHNVFDEVFWLDELLLVGVGVGFKLAEHDKEFLFPYVNHFDSLHGVYEGRVSLRQG